MIAIKTLALIFFFLPSFIQASYCNSTKISLKIVSATEQLKKLTIISITYQFFSLMILLTISFLIIPFCKANCLFVYDIISIVRQYILTIIELFLGVKVAQYQIIVGAILLLSSLLSLIKVVLKNNKLKNKDTDEICLWIKNLLEKTGYRLDAYIFNSIVAQGHELCLIRLDDKTCYIGGFYYNQSHLTINIDAFIYKALNEKYVSFMPVYKGKFEDNLIHIKADNLLEIESSSDFVTCLIKKEDILAVYPFDEKIASQIIKTIPLEGNQSEA